jgi:adenylate kinase
VPHLATGDILRGHVAEATPLGLEAKSYIEEGLLVPDRLVLQLVAEGITPEGREPLPGWVLDGFPRTLGQAEAAYSWARPNGRTFHSVISLDVPEDELVRRLIERGRRSGRTDDNEATIRERLRVFNEATAPLLDFYRGRDILVEVDGARPIDDVTVDIRRALDKLDLSS